MRLFDLRERIEKGWLRSVDTFCVRRLERLEVDGQGNVVVTHRVIIKKPAGLVPLLRAHLVHYHGVLGPTGGGEGQADGAAARGEELSAGLGGAAGEEKLIALIKKASVAEKILRAMGWGPEEIEAKSKARAARSLDPPGDTLWDQEAS
jgi:hypothetical protein